MYIRIDTCIDKDEYKKEEKKFSKRKKSYTDNIQIIIFALIRYDFNS